MTSYQSELGGRSNVAEELAESQRSISIAEFFEKNKHMLGFDSGARGLVTAVKEAVDNALDATEEAGILPDIYVGIKEEGDYYRVIVEDNGPGITKEQLPKVFGKLLYGSRFHVREQKRGQQGIGISAAVLYSQLTSGKPAMITSRTEGESAAQYFELIIDTDTNEPEISVDTTTTWDRPHGTRIELEMEANMRARQQLHDYIKHTAVVNPHARIEFEEPREQLKFERVTDQLPAETEEIRPHPHGIELGSLIKLLDETASHSISGFLQDEFTRVGQKTADSIITAFVDRHFGREMSWRPPERSAVETAVTDAVTNKSEEATAAFAQRIGTVLTERDRVAHHELVDIVANAAEHVRSESNATFGTAAQKTTAGAVWSVLTDDIESDLSRIVDDTTTSRKDAETIDGMARRIAVKFEDVERHRLQKETVASFVARAAEQTETHDGTTFGETAQENVVSGIWSVCRSVPDDPPKVRAVERDRDTASELLGAMRETDILAPPTDCLAPITETLVEEGLRKEFDADFYAATTRDAEVHGGDPFIVEAGIAYGGDIKSEGRIDVLRFANRVPLVYQRGACATADVIQDINWRNYNLDQPGGSGTPNGPAVVMIHVASTNVPFTSESKDAIANVPEIEHEIELALRSAARELKRYLKKRRTLEQRQRKRNVIADILPTMADKLADMTERESLAIEDSLARIMNNVLIERTVDNDAVRLVVTNHSDSVADLALTDIVSVDPGDIEDATVVEMDGEWFVKWDPSVRSGEQAVIEYDVNGNASFDISVEGIEPEKLSINA
ncbi:DNA topoisomerase VI subunit B [Halocatena pleomorpha]|uniref:Type 2 DNA topoisomerase 6 subunit B n=1 Tax=Halocatena pleomorpha TaxID=1785090 RepID=A0A3P3RDK2_9EURY|nr:DNA topoisomerase VI subunit B [Halocatena pleomorpha]RRJ31038.1 DNA topoisomerase VI subunit B [Halocatena pleomorpha]